jgi:hypothetical protein
VLVEQRVAALPSGTRGSGRPGSAEPARPKRGGIVLSTNGVGGALDPPRDQRSWVTRPSRA